MISMPTLHNFLKAHKVPSEHELQINHRTPEGHKLTVLAYSDTPIKRGDWLLVQQGPTDFTIYRADVCDYYTSNIYELELQWVEGAYAKWTTILPPSLHEIETDEELVAELSKLERTQPLPTGLLPEKEHPLEHTFEGEIPNREVEEPDPILSNPALATFLPSLAPTETTKRYVGPALRDAGGNQVYIIADEIFEDALRQSIDPTSLDNLISIGDVEHTEPKVRAYVKLDRVQPASVFYESEDGSLNTTLNIP